MRRIAVFTGTRAEYGLLYLTISGLHQAEDVELQLLVGGTHLSGEYGHTVDFIEKDGFPIASRMEFLLSSSSPISTGKSMALALMDAVETLTRLEPDVLVILGDRFEAMAVAQAAMLTGTPIAHIHGGERTEGAIDEAIRHSISKMSHLHFTATDEYRKRVIQLGEQPNTVFNFGAPGVDNIRQLKLLSRIELADSINFSLDAPFFLVTYHPVTLIEDSGVGAMHELLEVLDKFSNHSLVLTFPNADMESQNIVSGLYNYAAKNQNRVHLAKSLGQIRYLSAMKHCAAVIGNSSSGLIEAPSFGVPTINIGNRQKGRIACESVIHCDDNMESIHSALTKALTEDFKSRCCSAVNPYGTGDSSSKIIEILRTYPLAELRAKSFYDIL